MTMLICQRCGRRGTRGFTAVYVGANGEAEAHGHWRCDNKTACDRRERRMMRTDPAWNG